ncbi:4'-phosphopantetheinyl transferase family protein [Streptomyces sp. KLOTTS4A1]|uniref:4'-phosphopantetheinyl transferase family protein n=1 Tax=Streptomyces sp. KLOTTS4A1 TaxID=3390996 RepID=UPI0039F56751
MIETLRFGDAGTLPSSPPLTPEVWAVHGLAGHAPVLGEDERQRAAALRQEADRTVYIAVHTALRILTGAYLQQDPATLRFHREDCPGCGGPHGRPALPGNPLHFSLSHTKRLALLAFAPAPVGVDIEPLPAADVMADVAAALHPSEREELARLPEPRRPSAFARCWTRKEAVLKGTGEGIAGDGLVRTVVGTGPDPRPVPGWRIEDITAPAGYAAALAVAAPGPEPG